MFAFCLFRLIMTSYTAVYVYVTVHCQEGSLCMLGARGHNVELLFALHVSHSACQIRDANIPAE